MAMKKIAEIYLPIRIESLGKILSVFLSDHPEVKMEGSKNRLFLYEEIEGVEQDESENSVDVDDEK